MLAVVIFCILIGLWIGTKVERRSSAKNLAKYIEDILRNNRKGRK